MCSVSVLRPICVILGVILSVLAVVGMCASVYLLLGQPLEEYTVGTYTPNWEDIGPALFCSIITLLTNVILVGGAIQYSKNMVLVWLVWHVILVIIFWVWFGYNQLKHYGYVEWHGMKSCYFCGLGQKESYVSFGGAIATFCLLIALMLVAMLHSKYRRMVHRQLMTPAEHFYDPAVGPQYYEQQQQPHMMEYKF